MALQHVVKVDYGMFRTDIRAPITKHSAKTLTLHGDPRTDHYYWLNERDNPAVMAHLEEENAYLESVLEPSKELQEQLYQKLLSHIQETDTYVSVQMSPYFYYTRTEEGKQYPIRCRKKAKTRAELESAAEEIILDINTLAAGKAFLSVSAVKVSPDHSKLAYLQNEDGSDRYTLYIKNLLTGNLLAERIENICIGNSIEWADNQHLFYVTVDKKQRPYKLYRHALGETNDTLVYEERDEGFFVYLAKSDSEAFLFANLGSLDTSEVHFLSTQHPLQDWKTFAQRKKGVKYSLEHHEANFLIITNENAVNFKLLSTPVDKIEREHWRELLPHREDVFLQSVQVFEHHWLLAGRAKGLTQLWVHDVQTSETKALGFPESVYTAYAYSNLEFRTDKALIGYESMVTPASILELDLNTLQTTLLKLENVPNYTADDYTSERLWATASDGTQVPISILYKKGLAKPAPLLLYGYGSYGATVDPVFNSNRLALLDKGVAYAVAHVRGGAEMGRRWYEGGKLLHKKNTFTDFIACAEHLVAQGFTTPAKLAVMGVSAGGLLMGAITTMRPDLFKVVVAKVPFVDVVTTMLDNSLPLVTLEYDEWGNPNEKTFYDYMKSYSPYDNVTAKAYPHILATAGFNDPRVSYFEPAKWVAKLRECKTNENVVLLKTNLEAGHGGSSGRYNALREIALEYTFILGALEVELPN
jgi:oligopeptidase B